MTGYIGQEGGTCIMLATDIHPAIRACLGIHQGFKKLGFSGKDIFCGLANKDDVVVQLKTQGKVFTVNACKSDIGNEEFLRLYAQACEVVNGRLIPDEEFQKIWEDSLPYKDSIGFMAALLKKGIQLPSELERVRKEAERN